MSFPYKEEFYEVFARKDSNDTLQHVGSVKAPSSDIAITRAWYVYDQHPWSEMCLVPLAAVIPVTERTKRVKIKPI
ncbi:phenylacetic acid degradation b [Allopusillimonas ginsengisoli]|uniref:phenylacetic acid degradation b n=1 Tax=Allopusillimonas ginsengisoli TaxID=453575 RepID=UPI00101F89BA|nr:phenylacetic acid degradation b [Allopusillimonas ginsengisoli]TEA77782.1 phenylacetic acid degradation b [Allopusillimonas ginsengisoli]